MYCYSQKFIFYGNCWGHGCRRYIFKSHHKKKKKHRMCHESKKRQSHHMFGMISGIFFYFYFLFIFYLWWILSYIEMKQPWVYMCSPSRSPLPPPSPPAPSRFSQCTRSERYFICSSVHGHLGYFHVLATVSSVAMNTEVQVSSQILDFSGYIPRSDIAGSYGSTLSTHTHTHTHTHTRAYTTDKPQGPIVWHTELYSISYNNL